MPVGLIAEGGHPNASGDAGLWCDRLVRGPGQHEFGLYALSRTRQQEDEGLLPLPPQVLRVRTASLCTSTTSSIGETAGRMSEAISASYTPNVTASTVLAIMKGPRKHDRPQQPSGSA